MAADRGGQSRLEVYDREFFSSTRRRASRSAEAVVPYLMDLLDPESVVDVGCGTGSWLTPFAARGVEILGVDGPWAEGDLEIPLERCIAADLSLGLDLDRRFDLVLSLEVAEHLDAASASSFVAALAKLGPLILFSAAVPGQGGTEHLNEQWPEYWAELFGEEGFVPVDCVRKRFWSDERVAPYYSQNAVLFIEPGSLQRLSALRAELEGSDNGLPLPLVHPASFAKALAAVAGARRELQVTERRLRKELHAADKRLRRYERSERRSVRNSEIDRRELARLDRRLTALERSRWWRLGRRVGVVKAGG